MKKRIKMEIELDLDQFYSEKELQEPYRKN